MKTASDTPVIPRTLFSMTRAAVEVVFDKANEVAHASRYRAVGYYDYANELFVMRGGGWNGDYSRVGNGFTKADVEDVRRALKPLGFRMSFEQADAFLLQAQQILDTQQRRRRIVLGARRAA